MIRRGSETKDGTIGDFADLRIKHHDGIIRFPAYRAKCRLGTSFHARIIKFAFTKRFPRLGNISLPNRWRLAGFGKFE